MEVLFIDPALHITLKVYATSGSDVVMVRLLQCARLRNAVTAYNCYVCDYKQCFVHAQRVVRFLLFKSF